MQLLQPTFVRFAAAVTLLALVPAGSLRAADTTAGPDAREVKALVNKALTFLKTRQNDDGSFSPRLGGPGISALIVAGLIRNGVSPEDPLVAKTLSYLEKTIHKDGGIYDKGLANYTTSVALLAFREANTSGKYDTVIKNAAQFLKTL